jgi:mRNA-degrading endonuclease RelE of RelBE toxin-antitoxin system
MAHVELAPAAERDIRRLRRSPDLLRIRGAIEALGKEPSLDVRPLQGRAPWLRLRAGDWRILFRPLSGDEVKGLTGQQGRGFLVARVVNRRELERSIRQL